MKNQATGVRATDGMAFDGLEIYSVDGKFVKRIAFMDIDGSYADILSSLPKGIYVVRDKNGTRKVVKQR